MLGPLGATRHFASLRCLPRDECGTNAGRRPEVGGEPGRRTPALRIHEPPCARRESATDVRLDGEDMAADADDRDAGHASKRT
jgi:hypothetical protein